MTTQELKEYIGRVLGNGIRCLLPSYWWKRLFGLVVDKVEDVEGSIVTSIDEFAKNRPDIDDRTFYMSEDADLVAHNANTYARWYAELGSMKVKPFFIATPFSDMDDIVIWWIRSDGFEGTGYGPAFRNVIISEKKYNVMFLSYGSYISNEKPSDSITIDTEMSATSENAVQNKVIKAYVDKSIKDYDQSISEAILGELDEKVDKVEGKQLSTEDFTTALKTKLEGMSSFDPTEINNKVNGLQSQINTLVSGDASTAIESFNEIIAFLNGVQDTESLDGIIAGIEQQIAAKQDKIIDLETIRSGAALGATALQSYTEKYTGTYSKPSDGIPKADLAGDVQTSLGKADTALQEHQPLKTINGESIVGDGNIEIKANVDTSTLATKEMVTSLSNEVVANEEVTAAALNDLNERVNAISENVSGETATKVELQSAVESLTNTILENEEVTAAALNDLNERIENAGSGGTVDLSSYATKQEVKAGLNGKQDTLVSGTNIKTINGTSILGSGDIVINGGGEVDTELSETSGNAIANRVVTAEFNNIKEKIEGIENIVADNKVLLYLTIEGEPNNTLFENVKATITYGDTTVVAGNETVILPTFTEVTITFPSIDGYNKPQDIVFTTGWSDTIYKTGVYSILIPSYISIDQTITDPALMITGDVNGYEIQKIRNNSHRYLGKYTAEGTMTLCQLDDSDSTKYADGSTADLTGAEGDVFVKLPRFWYKAEEIQSDVWRIGFMCGNIAPSSEWKEWDGNDLIGAYEAYVESSKVYSRSGVSSSSDIAPSTYIANGASRGKGFSLVKWHHHNMMAFLFYAMYGNTNCQAIVGSGTSVDSKPTGQTDLLGMEDTSANTNGNSQSINFWGLENWWGNKFEIVDNVTYASKTYYITESDGVIRNVYSGLSNGSTWPKKLKIGEYLDCVPTLGGGSATTGYCDTCSPTDSGSTIYYLRRSYPREITGCGVVAFNTASSATSNGGSRLAFKGSIIEETNVNRFKLMEAIA